MFEEKERPDQFRVAVKKVCENGINLSKTIILTFPNFTLHDETHTLKYSVVALEPSMSGAMPPKTFASQKHFSIAIIFEMISSSRSINLYRK